MSFWTMPTPALMRPAIIAPPAYAWANLAALFSGGADGFMIDFTNKDTLFQDIAGATAVVSNGNPVGLALDQRKWGGQLLAAYRASQPELVVNGNFATDISGWTQVGSLGTITWNAGAMEITANAGSTPTVSAPVTGLVIGRWYEISVVITYRDATTSQGFFVGPSAGSSATLTGQNIATQPLNVPARRFFRATQTTHYVSCYGAGGAGNKTRFDNVSVKEVDGHHAIFSGSPSNVTWASATSDVVFNGSAYLSTDFYFASNNNFYSAWFNGLGSAAATRMILGAYDSSPNAQASLAQASTTGYGQVTSGGTGAIVGATSIVGTSGTLLADQTASLAEGFLNGVKFGQQITPGDLPDIADSVPVWIGTRNQNGAASLSMVGNLKRVVCGQISLQSQMSAADFHANLIAA